jgi:hypothetical protein
MTRLTDVEFFILARLSSLRKDQISEWMAAGDPRGHLAVLRERGFVSDGVGITPEGLEALALRWGL